MTDASGVPPDWPQAHASRRVRDAHDWHVQEEGAGPLILLLHGSGGATHTWRGIWPLMTRHARLVALDMPGQGFTRRLRRAREGIEETTEDILALMDREGWAPDLVVGHSAGTAVALRLAQARPGPRVAGINPALGEFPGAAGVVFPLIAGAIVANPLTTFALSRLASPARVARILRGTGSEIGAEGEALYGRLFARQGHVDATMTQMARWRRRPLRADLPRIAAPTLFVVGTNDRTVPPAVADEAAARMPDARVASLPGGHLVHEETPAPVADLLLGHLRAQSAA